jgi:hypothetical protein
MYTIFDYLEHYKDKDINEVSWNTMDNLLLAIIVYMPIDSFMGSKTFDEMCNIILNFKLPSTSEFISTKIKKIIEEIKDGKRYKNLKFINFVNRIDEDTQFGAMTCKIRNIKVISFKGTDKSIIGWVENFRLMYEYPTYTQNLAIKYLKNNIGLFDKNVYVIGHSKGGNLAMCSSMELKDGKFKKIKEVINLDGPGFKKREYMSPNFKKMSSKLTNIIPEGSYIGVLMFNTNYSVIKTSAHAINVHYPVYWNTYGSSFIDGKLSKLSEELHTRTSKNIQDINERLIKNYFETAFNSIDKKKSEVGFGFREFIEIIKGMKSVDNDTYKYVMSIFKSMIKISNKNKTIE